MTPSELQGRLAVFAREVALFARPLFERIETRDIARQLTRAAASAAANHRAAGRARSHAEFTAKIGVSLEESDEVVFWLEHLVGLQTRQDPAAGPLMGSARELVAILTASCKTARKRHVGR